MGIIILYSRGEEEDVRTNPPGSLIHCFLFDQKLKISCGEGEVDINHVKGRGGGGGEDGCGTLLR